MFNRIKVIISKLSKKTLQDKKELVVKNNLSPIQEKKECVKTNAEKENFKPSDSPSGC